MFHKKLISYINMIKDKDRLLKEAVVKFLITANFIRPYSKKSRSHVVLHILIIERHNLHQALQGSYFYLGVG